MADLANHGSLSLSSVWDAYRDWAAFAREKQASLFFWRKLVLSLGLGGAILETLAANGVGADDPVNFVAAAGAILLALAAYFGRRVLGGRPEREWVSARAVAESLKSECYKYCTGTPPYSGATRDENLVQRKTTLTESGASLTMIPDPSKRAAKDQPQDGLTTQEYIGDRIADQIGPEDGYYWRSARKNRRRVSRFRGIALALGAVSAILGGIGAFGFGSAASWVAVVTTLTSSLAAYFQAGRFEYLVLSYSATARRLTSIVDEWTAAGAKESTDLVQRCEDAISIENKGWLAEWLREPKGTTTADQSADASDR